MKVLAVGFAVFVGVPKGASAMTREDLNSLRWSILLSS